MVPAVLRPRYGKMQDHLQSILEDGHEGDGLKTEMK